MSRYILIAIVWLACSVVSYGMLYAHARHVSEYSAEGERADHIGSVWASVGGPLSLTIAIVFTDYAAHGVRWRRDHA